MLTIITIFIIALMSAGTFFADLFCSQVSVWLF